MCFDKNAAKFELEFFTKALIACGNFSLRYRGATETKSVVIKAEEEYEQGDKLFCFLASTSSIFFDLLEKLVPNLTTNAAAVTSVVETLLGQINGVPYLGSYDY